MNTNEENQTTKHKKRNPKKAQILPLNENKKQHQQKKNQILAKPEEILSLQLKTKGFIGVQRPVIIDELNINSEAIKYRHFGNLRKTLTDVNNSNETIDEDGRPQKRIKKCIIRCTHGFRTR